MSNVENLPPQVIRQVSKELSSLCQNAPEGIKIFTNDEDITDIQATIEGPGQCHLLHRVVKLLQLTYCVCWSGIKIMNF